jgi:uncharacterized protein
LDEIAALITRVQEAKAAQQEKQRAFGEVVRRFQDMAFACAYAVLADFQLAEDAAQEAFIAAWRSLDQLRAPEAFPGWFKRIVLTQCSRMTRNRTLPIVPLESAYGIASSAPEPQALLEQEELRYHVLQAIQTLSEGERVAVTLFYINDYAQSEIADFLEVPLTTVKKRLYCARQKLRETMLDLVRDTLQTHRPSNDTRFVDTVTLFNEALESFVAKVRQDRNILAAVLFGSLSHDKVWRKSDIDIILVGRDEKKPVREFCLVENGINIHAVLFPRGKFKQALEGSLQGSFIHSSFSKSKLLFTNDETLRDYYDDVQRVGAKDIEIQLMRYAQQALYTLAKAEKWLYTRNDYTYSFLWVLHTVECLAQIEVISKGEVVTREVVQQALRHNPKFFNALYFDLIHQRKDEETILAALSGINRYLDERLTTLFRPILDYLSEAGTIRSTTEINGYFAKQAQIESLAFIYEWLADKGVIQKVPAPLRLTEKSLVTVDEAAYYYDAGR